MVFGQRRFEVIYRPRRNVIRRNREKMKLQVAKAVDRAKAKSSGQGHALGGRDLLSHCSHFTSI